MRKVLLNLVLFLIFFSGFAVSAQETSPEINLPWPIDLRSTYDNYAQELLIDPDAGLLYIREARLLYNEGYELVQRYEGVEDHPDRFIRDPYKIYIQEMWNVGFKNDFSLAGYFFLKAYRIYTEKLQWDAKQRTTPEYQDLLKKVIKGLVTCTIYLDDLFRGNDLLDNYYALFPEDRQFYLNYKIKIMGMIIMKQEAYKIGFSGKMSTEYWKKKYRNFIEEMLKEYPGPEENKSYIRDYAVPDFSTAPLDMSVIHTNNK